MTELHEHADHDAHRHPPAQPDDISSPGHYELVILAMRDLLIEKGILTAAQIRRGLETLDSWQPSRGAEIVVRAWTDPAFKRRLLADSNEAVTRARCASPIIVTTGTPMSSASAVVVVPL